ncbi:class I SAM-dependent methyltransferase [Thiobacillus sp. 65-1402]|uniref:class I SAM-dependent methyltransferase n=1 Tax=Thiobacillus sp. 65-1402 TaxID=1895861 RepID=UPI0025D151C5|nr:class I SAM-dependent methyltransferase [Thiobacillus sp. 65-1402]
MENVVCYNCGSASRTAFAQENDFSLTKCSECGLLYVNPRPNTEEIEQAHKLGQHRGAELIQTTGYYDFSKVSSYTQTLKEMFGDGSVLKGKRWLDIGCGYGEFLEALNKFSANGVIARGVEPNVKKAAMARKNGLNVDYFDLSGHREKYDYISMLNVYSHLPDPPAIIGEWKKLLMPGGRLILETGDTSDLTSELHPKPFYLPDHLSFASEKIVTNILQRAGFDILGVYKYAEVRETPMAIFREALKALIPGKRSKLWRLIKGDLKQIDMYVHARLK